MTRSRNIKLPTEWIGWITAAVLASLFAAPVAVFAQTRVSGPQSNANNANPGYGSGARFTQSGAQWNRYERTTLPTYNNLGYPGCIYPGVPTGSITYVQPDGYGGYAIGTYGYPPTIDTTLPSVYGLYGGASGYVDVNEGSVQDILPVTTPVYGVVGEPSVGPQYQENDYSYTINNYYSGTPNPSDSKQSAISSTSDDGYNAALGDLQQAWSTGDFSLLKKHLPSAEETVKVSVGGQASYPIASGKFADITQLTFTKLVTYSFVVTDVEKHADGSVTGYVTHTYAAAGAADGKRQTMYLAFVLSRSNGAWVITEMDSSKTPISISVDLSGKSASSAVTAATMNTYSN